MNIKKTVIILIILCFPGIVLARELLHKQEIKHPSNIGKVTPQDLKAENPDISNYIPALYGKLVQVEKGAQGYDKYLWFEAKDGTIRRVQLIYQTDNYISISNKVEVFKRK